MSNNYYYQLYYQIGTGGCAQSVSLMKTVKTNILSIDNICIKLYSYMHLHLTCMVSHTYIRSSDAPQPVFPNRSNTDTFM